MEIISEAISDLVSDFNQLQTHTVANLGGFVDGYKTASSTYPNEFSTIERISAGYLMNTMDFGRWRIVAGVRFEGTQMNAFGYNVTLYPAGSANCPHSPPSCGVPVPVRHNSHLCGRASQSLASVMRWTTVQDSASSLRARHIAAGCLPARSLRYGGRFHEPRDCRPRKPKASARTCQQLRSPLRAIPQSGRIDPVAGFFYKQLSDTPDQHLLYTAASGPYVGDLVSQCGLTPANAWTSTVSRFPTNSSMSWLPKPFSALGLLANYSWTASKINSIPGRSDSPTLQRQAPNTWNISPTYDRGRVSIRVGLSYNGPSIYQYEYQSASDPSGLGANGPSGDVYTLPHMQLDAQGSLRIGHGLTCRNLRAPI